MLWFDRACTDSCSIGITKFFLIGIQCFCLLSRVSYRLHALMAVFISRLKALHSWMTFDPPPIKIEIYKKNHII